MPETERTHPAVDWLTTEHIDGRLHVQVTCPWCKEPRLLYAADVRRRIKQGTFKGHCYKDRLINGRTPLRHLPSLPSHPAVDWEDKKLIWNARQRLQKVGVTCPECSAKRYADASSIVIRIRKGSFTAICRACGPNAAKVEWVDLGPGRRLNPKRGYIYLTRQAIATEHAWLYDGNREGRRSGVPEHRMVMAIHLQRPLRRDELVDHMDGDKTNNQIENLRVYRKGRNDPGSHNGYGTYYHEWQKALAEVAALRAELARTSSQTP